VKNSDPPRPRARKVRVFTVQWVDSRRRWIAADQDGNDLGVSTDMNNAVGSAVREANEASKAGYRVSVKVQQGNGSLRTEYVAKAAAQR
jgi:hypothetical protein